MTKLCLTLSTKTLECICCDESTAKLLGCADEMKAGLPVHISALLANLQEFQSFQASVRELVKDRQELLARSRQSPSGRSSFSTLNLVFSAPHVDQYGIDSNRRALEGVFASPMRAMHCCGELQLACFTHIELSGDCQSLFVSALEYAREHRQRLHQQEFGSWLLEQNIEKSVIATTMAGEVVFWNRYAENLYQYTRQEALGKSVMELTPSDMTMDQAVEIMSKLGKGQRWSGMFRVKRKDKTQFMAHVTDTPILDAAGGVKFIVGVSDDYTQLHDVMEQLECLNTDLENEVQSRTAELLERESNLRMVGAAIRASDTGVIMTGCDHRILWSNMAADTMLGMEQSETSSQRSNSDSESPMIGVFPWDLAPLQQPGFTSGSELSRFLHSAFTEKNGSSGQQLASPTLKTGGYLPIEAIAATVQRLAPGADGEEQHMITLRDMTTQLKADEAQRRADAAAAASETKTETMQMLSHDLRTPLQGILGVASTMLLDLRPEESNLYDGVATILASARLLLTLIGNVLDLRKVELNMMNEVELGPIPIHESISESIRYCEPFAMVNDVKLRSEGLEVSSLAQANRLRVEQVLVNLLTNSIKYTTPCTEVLVSLRRSTAAKALAEARAATASDLDYRDKSKSQSVELSPVGDVLIVSVRDHGRGIPDDEVDKVFQAYAQLRISDEKDREYHSGDHKHVVGQSSGSGLGLNLVMKFLDRMHGHIWFQNALDGGVTFSFCLPVSTVEPSQAIVTEVRVDHEAHLTPEVAARFRALVVDDSVINVKVLMRMLRRLGVENIDFAYSGGAALELIESLQQKEDETLLPNMILSDLQMPKMSGEELAEAVRAKALSSNPVVMACTADWTASVEQRCRDAGFDGVLRKPIGIRDLEEFLVRVPMDKAEADDEMGSPETTNNVPPSVLGL